VEKLNENLTIIVKVVLPDYLRWVGERRNFMGTQDLVLRAKMEAEAKLDAEKAQAQDSRGGKLLVFFHL